MVLPRVFRLEGACTWVLFASPGKGVVASNSIVGITRKGSLSLIGSKPVRLFMVLAGSFVPIWRGEISSSRRFRRDNLSCPPPTTAPHPIPYPLPPHHIHSPS